MTFGPHSRRDALKLLGAGAAAFSCAAVARVGEGPDIEDEGHLAPTARYFPLSQVRLGPGPFLDAQRLDADYLLRLDPDRLLHNFRVNAGLAPKAPVYGGWESVEPWVEIRCHGHTLGHYLGAAACMFQSTADDRFAQRVDHVVADLAECQAKTGGWLTAFPDGVAPLTDSLAGKPFAGVPWYTTHKVMAGLRDAWLHRGSTAARDVLMRFAEWIRVASADVPDDRLQKMLDREHGGMNEVLADVAEISGNPLYLELAQRFSHRALLDPLIAGRDTLDGLHANTQIPKVIGFERIAEQGGGPGNGEAAAFFWQTVTRTRSYATGGHGDNEHFFPRHEFVQRLGSGKTMETCCTHNMLRLTRALYARRDSPEYMDYFERALFNGILASQDPETGMNTYFQSTRPGYVRLYHTPFDSFWCCTGSGIENHARYGETIYARHRDALTLNHFIASTLDWRERGVRLTQHTSFPDSDTTRLTFEVDRPQTIELFIRQPAWCAGLEISINGRRDSGSVDDGYRRVKRRFRSGDVVDVRMPMTLHVETLPGEHGVGALMFGPIVLAARLGTAGLTPGSQLIVNERESGKMLNADVEVPRWTRPLAELPASMERVGSESLRFRATGFGGGAPVEFIPFFRVAHERYNLYWRQG
jgi:DUF1680 family protein